MKHALAVGDVEDAFLERRMEQVALDGVQLRIRPGGFGHAQEALRHVHGHHLGPQAQRDDGIAAHPAARVEDDLARELLRRDEGLFEEEASCPPAPRAPRAGAGAGSRP